MDGITISITPKIMFLGITALVLWTFFPGIWLAYMQRNIMGKISVVMAASIGINTCAFLFLSLAGINTRITLLATMLLLNIILLLYRREKSTTTPEVEDAYVSLKGSGPRSLFSLSIVLLAFLLCFFFVSTFFTPFTSWDSYASWNRWGVVLANAKGMGNLRFYGTYPPLLPISYAGIYKLMGTTSVQLFAHGLHFIFLLIFIFSIYASGVYFKFSLTLLPFLIIGSGGLLIPLINNGFADFPAAAFSAAALMMLFRYFRSSHRHWMDVVWIFFFSSLTGLTKQLGLGMHICMLAYILYLFPKRWRQTGLIFVIVSFITILPHYLRLLLLHESFTATPRILMTAKVLYGGHTSYWWKFIRSIRHFPQPYILLLMASIATAFSPRQLRVFFWVTVIPLWSAWVYTSSYSTRNMLLLTPIMFLAIGAGADWFVKRFTLKPRIKTVLSIAVVLLLVWSLSGFNTRSVPFLINVQVFRTLPVCKLPLLESYGDKLNRLFPWIAPIEDFIEEHDVQHIITTDPYTRLLLPTLFSANVQKVDLVEPSLPWVVKPYTSEFYSAFLHQVELYGLRGTVLIVRRGDVASDFAQENLPQLFKSTLSLPGGRILFHNY